MAETIHNTLKQIAHAQIMSDFYAECSDALFEGVDSKKRGEWKLKAQQLRDGQKQNIQFIEWANKRK